MNCDRIKICLKPTDNNLSWYTIDRSIVKEGKFIRQTSGRDSFAIIILKIEPYSVKEVAIFENKIAEINLGKKTLYPLLKKNEETLNILQTICSGVILGIEAACLGLDSQIAVASKVTALKASFHTVDSHYRAFKMATKSALLEALGEVKLIKI